MNEVIISVRGEHEERLAPEEAVAAVSIRAEGPDRADVVERLTAEARPLRQELETAAGSGAVREWSTQRMAVWAERPWNADGNQLAPVHHASLGFSATFVDFDELSRWISDVSVRDGVQVDGVDFVLSPITRSRVETDVATRAVRVALDRATAYASALGFMEVEPRQIADVGLLTGGESASGSPGMLRMAKASYSADAASGVSFEPQEVVVAAAVEARFAAR